VLIDPCRFVEPFMPYIDDMKKAIVRLDAIVNAKEARNVILGQQKGVPKERQGRQRNVRDA
jgi:hypothetical protein